MKFYHTADGRWATARPASKAAAAEWAALDLDTSQRGFLAFLNEHRVGASDRVEITVEPTLIITQPPAPPPAPADPWPARYAQEISVEEAIAEADYPRALALAHHVHHRLMEFARKAKP
ncbi:hypothetical protein M9978_08265 [Sphingomonas sp. MG17]|uniref:Uncharacterized protein n=1 Tax=Sphingomonas tagetis TaxID=2949092 RepID=A0A9X2KLI0_9SPHN|nr:hypothetical protein [Sphingomonas tagetis]MCP3730421.1 hypothetical protein [Sphingomonas tagetis]